RGGTRVVVNREDVDRSLCRFGLTAVDMAKFSVGEQIAAVRGADLLAGPHGAGLIHCMFLNEHSTVIECFSPEYLNPSVREICRLLRHQYFQVVSPNTPTNRYPHGMNVEVDCNHLELVLQGLQNAEEMHLSPLANAARTSSGVIASLDKVWHDIEATSSRRSEEHTSELQSQSNLVCRLLLEKKKK